jgi:hypothetical protein
MRSPPIDTPDLTETGQAEPRARRRALAHRHDPSSTDDAVGPPQQRKVHAGARHRREREDARQSDS